jgi:hypothetical protein
MSIPRIYGIYLNSLSWHQIGNLYTAYIKNGRSKYKIDRINDMVNEFNELPANDIIYQYLFAGRISVNWYQLNKSTTNQVEEIKKKLNSISPDILKDANYVKLDEGFNFIHAIERQNKLFITLGTGDYRDSVAIQNYTLTSYPSEYFCTVVLRKDKNVVEVRANDTIRGQVLSYLLNQLALSVIPRKIITENEFMNFKDSIPDASIKKYKGKNLDPKSLTDLFEFTARHDVDYAQDTVQFEQMRQNTQDLSLTIVFDYDGSTFPFRFNLLTGSLYFPSIVSEDAIDYIFNIYLATIIE